MTNYNFHCDRPTTLLVSILRMIYKLALQACEYKSSLKVTCSSDVKHLMSHDNL